MANQDLQVRISRGRDCCLDVTRMLCVLYIVGYWHLKDYLSDDFAYWQYWNYGGLLTICVLSTFTFLSGYFLKRHTFVTWADVGRFYVRRFWRLWPLCFLSAIVLQVGSQLFHYSWYSSWFHFLCALFGGSVFFNPQEATLWYVGMLMLFYWLTPLVLRPKRPMMRLLVALVLVSVMFALVYAFHLNYRVLLYLPSYLLGLLLPNRLTDAVKRERVACAVLSGLSLFVVITHVARFSVCAYYLLVLQGPVFLIALSALLTPVSMVRWLGRRLSYASLCMYLFHRHIYLFVLFVASVADKTPLQQTRLPFALLFFGVLPVIAVSSYFIQRVYDRLTARRRRGG